MLALLDVAQELREAEHHRGVHPGAVAHGTPHEGIIILEHQRIGVDKKQFFIFGKRGACGRLRVTARRDCPRRTTRHRRSPSRRAAGHGALPPAGRRGAMRAAEVGKQVLARGLPVAEHDIGKTAPRAPPRSGAVRSVRRSTSAWSSRATICSFTMRFSTPKSTTMPCLGSSLAFRRPPLHGNVEAVGVAVQLAARAVVALQRMRRLERELLGQSDYCHNAKVTIIRDFHARRLTIFHRRIRRIRRTRRTRRRPTRRSTPPEHAAGARRKREREAPDRGPPFSTGLRPDQRRPFLRGCCTSSISSSSQPAPANLSITKST